jgi:hypothetical protein
MESVELLQYPVLDVLISGNGIDNRPTRFTLSTDQDYPSVIAKLTYPANTITASAGDQIEVSLRADTNKTLLFTGEIFDAKTRGALYHLSLIDGYKKLCGTQTVNAYRKETANIILQDTLDTVGITDTVITCPSVTLARFSTDRISAAMSITLLIKALEQHGISGLRFFFDEQNIFRFGTGADTGRNEGVEIALETGKTIIKTGEGYIETLPLPVRHTQRITVNNKQMETTRTELTISSSRSRLRLWAKELI